MIKFAVVIVKIINDSVVGIDDVMAKNLLIV